MTPIADMVARLVDAGTPPGLAAEVVVEAYERGLSVHRTVHGLSTDNVDDKREKDRLRKREERAKDKELREAAKANDVAAHPQPSAGLSTDSADKRCDLTSFLSSSVSEESEKVKEGKKQTSVVERGKRGTRLAADAPLSDADRQFAREQGMQAVVIKQAWHEFRDYWIGVPGQRGTKLDWPATWRNRVRSIKFKRFDGGHNGQTARRGGLAGALAKLGDTIERLETEGNSDSGKEPPRLLSHR